MLTVEEFRYAEPRTWRFCGWECLRLWAVRCCVQEIAKRGALA